MTSIDAERVDFGLDEMPGAQLHQILRVLCERGPIVSTRFLGTPAFVICREATLSEAFRDDWTFPGHRMYQGSFEPAIGESFISEADSARHLRYRKLATPAFRSRAVTHFVESSSAALAHEILDQLEGRTEFDLVEQFTARFPYLVITRLLGLPREREEEFHAWALALLTFREDPGRALKAKNELSEFLRPVVEARRNAPRNDVISALLESSVDGRQLSDEEVFSHIRLLFPTGGETTHGSLGNLLYALLSEPKRWQGLVDSPERIPAIVDEGLRWETPIAVLPRMSRSEEVEFAGTRLPADSWVLFAVAAANRDPALLDDADQFDPERVQPPNLVFGRGPKSCPGLHFARRNLEVALRVLSERIPQLELTDLAAAQPRGTVLRSPAAIRVRRLGSATASR